MNYIKIKRNTKISENFNHSSLLLNFFFVTKSKSHFQIFILKASRVDLESKLMNLKILILPKIPFQK